MSAGGPAASERPDEVLVHLHHTMTGGYPLRLVDLLFCAEAVLVVEYDYLTGVDLLRGGAERRARAFAEAVTEGGVDAALSAAEHVRGIAYDDLRRVTVHDGGRLGREKVTLSRAGGDPLTVRVHGEVDLEAFVGAVEATVGDGTDVEAASGLGLGVGRLADRLRRRLSPR